jgi:hypothetical protein
MIKVILTEGGTYIGKDAGDIIIQLKLEDWTSYNNIGEYQKNIQRRVRNFNGEQIKYNTEDEFLEELKRIEFISQIEK